MNNFDVFSLKPSVVPMTQDEIFIEKFLLWLQLDDVNLLKDFINNKSHFEIQQDLILNQLKKSFSFNIANFIYENHLITDFPQKLYSSIKDNNKLLPLLWIISNEKVFCDYCKGFLEPQGSGTSPDILLNNLFGELNDRFRKSSVDLFIYAIQHLGKSNAFKELVKSSFSNNSDLHKEAIKTAFSLFVNMLTECKEYFFKNKEIGVTFLKSLFPEYVSPQYLSHLFSEEDKNYRFHHYRRRAICLLLYAEIPQIREFTQSLVKKIKQYNSPEIPPFFIDPFILNHDSWKNSLNTRVAISQNGDVNEDEYFLLMMVHYIEDNGEKISDHLTLNNNQKIIFFERLLKMEKSNPYIISLLTTNLGNEKLKKELFQTAIAYANKHGNYQLTYFVNGKEAKVSLFDILIKKLFINDNAETANFNKILSNKDIVEHIIQHNILEQLRGYSAQKLKNTKTRIKKIELIEKAVANHIKTSLDFQGENNGYKKNKFKI